MLRVSSHAADLHTCCAVHAGHLAGPAAGCTVGGGAELYKLGIFIFLEKNTHFELNQVGDAAICISCNFGVYLA